MPLATCASHAVAMRSRLRDRVLIDTRTSETAATTTDSAVDYGPRRGAEPPNIAQIYGLERLRFPLKEREALGVLCQRVRQDFDCHLAAEVRVSGAIDCAHPADPRCVPQ
jgi:hypothetical protein